MGICRRQRDYCDGVRPDAESLARCFDGGWRRQTPIGRFAPVCCVLPAPAALHVMGKGNPPKVDET